MNRSNTIASRAVVPALAGWLMLSLVACGPTAGDEGEGEAAEGEGEAAEGEGEAAEGEGELDPCLTAPALASLFPVAPTRQVDVPDTLVAAVVANVYSSGPRLLAVDTSLDLRDLGPWPALGSDADLGSILFPDDVGSTAFFAFLAADDSGNVATGYSREDFSGAIRTRNFVDDGPAIELDAATAFSADWVDGELLVEGAGIGAGPDGAGVYALDGSAASLLFSLGAGAFTGYLSRFGTDGAVVGRYTTLNELFLFDAPALSAARASAGNLDALAPSHSGDLGAVAPFGSGAAVILQPGFVNKSVAVIDEGGAMSGPLVDVGESGCATLAFIGRAPDGVLVGLSNTDGLVLFEVAAP